MDVDDFLQNLLGDGASLANTATLGGQADILSAVTGQNLTSQYLASMGIGNAAAQNQQLLVLILMGFAIYMIVKHA